MRDLRRVAVDPYVDCVLGQNCCGVDKSQGHQACDMRPRRVDRLSSDVRTMRLLESMAELAIKVFPETFHTVTTSSLTELLSCARV